MKGNILFNALSTVTIQESETVLRPSSCPNCSSQQKGPGLDCFMRALPAFQSVSDPCLLQGDPAKQEKEQDPMSSPQWVLPVYAK